MKKIEKMMQKYAAMQAGLEALRHEAGTLEAKKADLTEKANAAAEAGDVTRYQEYRDELRKVEDELFVKNMAIRRATIGVSAEEAVVAWTEYSGKASEELRQLDISYQAAKKALFEKYEDLIKKQKEILSVRSDCATASNSPKRAFVMGHVLDHSYTRDSQFYMHCGYISLDESGALNQVVNYTFMDNY